MSGAAHRPGTVEAARLAADEAMTPLHGLDGLLTHPFTEARRDMARNRLKAAMRALGEALAAVETADLEPPFIGGLEENVVPMMRSRRAGPRRAP